MKKISCIYATARQPDAMIGRKNEDHITLFLDSLKKQSVNQNDFEVMIADCYYNKRKDHIENNTYKGVNYPFKIYHWQVKSPWLNRGLWAGQAPWNQGIMLSDAELIVTFGDCCEPPPDYLERMYDWYKKGYFAQGLLIYKINNKLGLKSEVIDDKWNSNIIYNMQELIKRNWDSCNVIRDSRWIFVEKSKNGIFIPKDFHSAESFHGYAAVPLEALLKINGFDENIDGSKSVGDCDTGIRLFNAGYREKLVLDRNLWLFENGHEDVPRDVLFYDGPGVRSNLGLMMFNNEVKRTRSNSYILSEKDLNWIWNYAHTNETWAKTYDYRQNVNYLWWIKHQPVFDLNELRNQVQKNLKNGIVEIPEYYKGD